jgi:hypothetical protein
VVIVPTQDISETGPVEELVYGWKLGVA